MARRVIGGGWGAAWKASLLANLATTIAGVPVIWLVMLLVQLVVSLIGAGLELGPEWSWIGTPFVLAWLSPHVERAAWPAQAVGAAFLPLFALSGAREQVRRPVALDLS